jgi:hypothetical protein
VKSEFQPYSTAARPHVSSMMVGKAPRMEGQSMNYVPDDGNMHPDLNLMDKA